MNEVFEDLTVGELIEYLEKYSDDTKIFVKTWTSEPKKEIEVIEGIGYIILKGN